MRWYLLVLLFLSPLALADDSWCKNYQGWHFYCEEQEEQEEENKDPYHGQPYNDEIGEYYIQKLEQSKRRQQGKLARAIVDRSSLIAPLSSPLFKKYLPYTLSFAYCL